MLNIIPLSGQSLAQTRDGIRQNFIDLNRGFSVDHVTYNALTDEGKHNKVTLPVQVADPSTNTTEMAIYSKEVSGTPQLFIRRANDGSVINFTNIISGVTGETTLPSGIKLKWGRDVSDVNGIGIVTFNALGLTNFTTIFTAYATISVIGSTPNPSENTDRIVRIYNYTNTTLEAVTYIDNVPRTRASNAFTWLAIGV